MRTLIRYGADPNTCSAEFHRLVRGGDGNIEFTIVLLNSRSHAIAQLELNKALLTAVEQRWYLMTRQLLAFRVDPNYSSGQDFTQAVRSANLQLLTLLLITSGPVRIHFLQIAMDHVCRASNWTAEIKVSVMDLLLSAGGKTLMPCLVDLLRIAVKGVSV
jgi:hypothetical protein